MNTTHEDGIDYASIDGNKFNYPTLFASILFAYARVAGTYRGAVFIDATHAELRAHAPAGKHVGGYLILGWHGPSPEEQAEKAIAAHGDRRPGEMPFALDLEADSASALGMTYQACLDWAHRAYDVLVKYFGVHGVIVYNSARVYADVFGNLPSRMGASPGWIKIPYPMAARQPPRPDLCPPMSQHLIPPPWRAPDSPGARVEQHQGDAIGVDGASSTIDLNRFVPIQAGDRGNGVAWLQGIVGTEPDGAFGEHTKEAVQRWQTSKGLIDTGAVDLATFLALLETAAA